MRRLFHSLLRGAPAPACIIILFACASLSSALDAADLKRIVHAYADAPGDTLFLHVHTVAGVAFDLEPLTWHSNIALDTVNVSNTSIQINDNAAPSFHALKICVADLNAMSSNQCRDWSSLWSKPAWDAASNRCCQRGACSIVLLLQSQQVREAECSALPITHVKKMNGNTSILSPNSPPFFLPLFHITHPLPISDASDPRLARVLHEQLALHAHILGASSHVVPPFPADFADMKSFFVGQVGGRLIVPAVVLGCAACDYSLWLPPRLMTLPAIINHTPSPCQTPQEHIMSELRDILSLRAFDEGAQNSKVAHTTP